MSELPEAYRIIEELPFPGRLKELLRNMLVQDETQRPSVKDIQNALSATSFASDLEEHLSLAGYEIGTPLVSSKGHTRVDVRSGKRLALMKQW